MNSSKHLINEINDSVRESLIGLASHNDSIQIIDDCNAVIRKDFLSFRSNGNVLTISGGGSGHEPQTGGYVGKGLLTAAVAGNIFASPSAGKILKVIKTIASKDKNSGGVLLIALNYTGDRLSFGLACEKAKLEGYNVDMYVIGDDCTVYSGVNRVGKRGLCGLMFVQKVAGALSEDGIGLDQIKKQLLEIDKKIGTFSVSLTACTVPGHLSSFTIGSDELEFGLGIHGEAGLSRMKICPAKRIVELMLNQLFGPLSKLNQYFTNGGERRIAVIVNNLGGVPQFELNIVANDVIQQLNERKFIIERFYCGTYISSFNMYGVSITVMGVNDHLLKLLDAPCNSTAWTLNITPSFRINNEIFLRSDESDHTVDVDYDAIDGLKFGREIFLKSLKHALEDLISSESYLNELDRESGDGDTGSTIAECAKFMLKLLNEGKIVPSFLQLSNLVELKMGGSSGALYSLMFTEASHSVQKLQINDNINAVDLWTQLLKNCIDTITKYSFAKPGDRSMIDSLDAAYSALSKAKQYDNNYTQIINDVAKQTKEAAEKTLSMKAMVGRASYVETHLLTKPDPGAMAVCIWINSITDTIKEMTKI